ncbi:MAG: ABC transporter substrate-binding protein [Methylobacterium sp.]|nr:ABC transporter substrate-binding protein [Methylobacterium sp.]MCA3639654.1 ABC transporter substrate-binding protein [Methylobacterium sp.]
MDRRQVLTLVGAGASLPLLNALPARAQGAPEKPKLTLGVGGKALLYYLPLTIAERQGHFRDFGLDVEINDFAGGARSLQALVGGSVDLVTGAYEHTIRMQAKGQDIRSTLELLRFPTIVIAVRKDLAGKVKSAADLKGLKIGVTAPGSSTHITAVHALVKAGLKPTDASFIGVGAGASGVAAMKKGEIDAISHLEPVISKLESDGDIVVMIDTRTEAGTRALFGATNPAACLYLRQDFIEKNPNTTQATVNALYKALRWVDKASPEQIADAVPEQFHLGDKALYIRAVKASKDAYSKTGIMQQDGMWAVANMLKSLDPELANLESGLVPKTFEARFAAKAATTVS